MSAVLTPIDSQTQNQICSLICETIVRIQTQHPELLQEKYRSVPWSENKYQEGLNTKLVQILDSATDWPILLQRVQKFLKTLLVVDAFKSSEFADLKSQINHFRKVQESEHQNIEQAVDINQNSAPVAPQTVESEQYIHQETSENLNQQQFNHPNSHQPQENNYCSLLILDAQYLKVTIEVEKFLSQICNFPLQIKIAIADWSQQSTFADEFYQRGYDLLHIPGDNLYLGEKIATFAASIPEKFPQVKEVLICTSISVCQTGDNPVENLSQQLQQSGLAVYQITQAENKIFAVNQQTRESHIHNLIPTFDQFTSAIAKIIGNEESETGNHWIGVSKIADIFASKYQVNLDTVVKHHLPGQSIQDVLKGKSDLVTYQPRDDSEFYVTQFRLPNPQ